MIFMSRVKCMVSKAGCLVQIQIVSSCVTRKKIFIVFFHLVFPCDSDSKESAYNVGDLGSIPGLERSSGEGKGYPLQYSGLENSMASIVHVVAKSRI